ncbi:conserved hypothetical protein [Methanohalobium evestigatum Z-7303]|uniref:DUF7308 domain-containing protein n=1 Tax=Methanohalobium evestigatum (strain ATCC BAA-1072 / DSM 3721 / NBRC 107634 / OCM 161 / Z-7303) TaxID=644295 RepID=D7E849_METEZ|nr:hypothetical protein [Methanohalobium evestigatum]ADI73391.1 conserved hypothetical protein [Methanohalobium evestigatum Z-7303]
MNLKFLKSSDAVSSVVGMVLILGITMISISAMMVYSYPTIYELEDDAKAQRVEQGLTVLDSRTSKVALGESPGQTTDISLMGGTINVNGETEDYNKSKMVVVSTDIDASWYDDFKKVRHQWGCWENYTDNDGFIKFNCSLGSIEYIKDGRKVAYEGGGVWSKYPEGNAIMISPPEFHYNGETLTLPLMKVNGDSSVSGKGKVSISMNSDNIPEVLYPNTTADKNRTNPLKSDKIFVYIKSKYYRAWADYASSQTYSSSLVDTENNTAIIELETIPPQGTSTLTDSFKVGALNTSKDEPMYDFSFDLVAEGSQKLNPSDFKIKASSGNKTLTYRLKKSGGTEVQIWVEYEDITVKPDYKEHWTGVDTFPNEKEVIVNFLNDSFVMEYTPPSSDGSNPDFSWNKSSDISIPPDVVINDGNTSFTLNDLSQHYLKLITRNGTITFDITWPGNSNPVDFDESSIVLGYDSMPGSITYLHVTKNELMADVY